MYYVGNSPKNVFFPQKSVNRYSELKFDSEDAHYINVLTQPIQPNSRVLDLGCGHGRFGKVLKSKNCKTYGVDIDPVAAECARQSNNYEKVWSCNVETEQNDESKDFFDFLGKNPLDVIILADVLEHLQSPEQLLNKIVKYLKDNGKIMISIPNVSHSDVVFHLLQGKFNYSESGILDNTHLKFFTRSSFYELIESMNNCFPDFKCDCKFLDSTRYAGKILQDTYRHWPELEAFFQINPDFDAVQLLFELTKLSKDTPPVHLNHYFAEHKEPSLYSMLKGLKSVSNFSAITKQIVFFEFSDPFGIVDDYIVFLLNSLQVYVDEIVVMYKELNDDQRSKFPAQTKFIEIPQTVKTSSHVFRYALNAYGWENVGQFEEVIYADSNLYGPIVSLDKMFSEMSIQKTDLWGLNWNRGASGKLQTLSKYLSHHFLAFRRNLITSPAFKLFWQSADSSDLRFVTKYVSEKGFKVSAWLPEDLSEVAVEPLLLMPSEVVENYKTPFVLRESFCGKYERKLSYSLGNVTNNLVQSIQKVGSYDVNMIWTNILRTGNMTDIRHNLQLDMVLPDQYTTFQQTKHPSVALMFHLFYEDQVELSVHYARSMPEWADIYLTVTTQEMFDRAQQAFAGVTKGSLKVIMIENRGRDVSSLLVGCAPYVKDYDYICFCHDKKTTQFNSLVGGGFRYKCFENILGTRELVLNIIDAFEKNPRLGMLTPPPPNHGNFVNILGHEWTINYSNTKKLVDQLGLKIVLDELATPSCPLGTMFWFRASSMQSLFDQGWKFSDFPPEPNGVDGSVLHALERIYSLVVQDSGYYVAHVLANNFAALEISNLYSLARIYNQWLMRKGMYPESLEQLRDFLSWFGGIQCFSLREIVSSVSVRSPFRYFFKLITPVLLWDILITLKNTFSIKKHYAIMLLLPPILLKVLYKIKNRKKY